jgi:hypothetical protein
LTLWACAARPRAWPVVLGLALGCALLSRSLAWGLVLGVATFAARYERIGDRPRWFASALIAALTFIPFIISDARNEWQNFNFSFLHRHELAVLLVGRPISFYNIRSLIFGLAISALALAVSRGDERALIRYTAVPLAFLLTGLSLVENVLPHWFLGPLVSTTVGAGMALAAGPVVRRRACLTASALVASAAFAGSLLLAAPLALQQSIRARFGLENVLEPDAGVADQALAAALSDIAATRGASVMTESYAVGAELEYYGLPVILTGAVGGNSGDEMRKQRDGRDVPSNVLFVGFDKLNDAATARCKRAYRDVEPGPVLRRLRGGVPIKPFYTLWCSRAAAGAADALYGEDDIQSEHSLAVGTRPVLVAKQQGVFDRFQALEDELHILLRFAPHEDRRESRR